MADYQHDNNTAMVIGALMDVMEVKELRLPMANLHTVSGSVTIDYDIDTNAYVIRKWDHALYEKSSPETDLPDGNAT